MMQKVQNKEGFTLIELLVVISIIGFLVSVAFYNFNLIRSKGREARRMSDLRQISKAIELYYDDNKAYPTGPVPGCATSDWSSWGTCWTDLLPKTYLANGVPADPLNIDLMNCGSTPNCYLYEYCNLGDHYVLVANLENKPDHAYANRADCPNGGPNRFWISNQ